MRSPASPPRLPRLLLAVVVPVDQHDSVLGDLDEEYLLRVHPSSGAVKARVWYWLECSSLVRAFLKDRLWRRQHGYSPSRMNRRVETGSEHVTPKGRTMDMTAIFKDFKFGLRSLAKKPGSAIISVLVLSIGIGLSTFMFSIVYGVWLRGLDFPGADRLTLVWETKVSEDDSQRRVPVHDLYDWREQQRSFEGLFGWYGGTVNVSGAGEDPERLAGVFVTVNMFDLIRAQPTMGRSFRAGDEQPGAPLTAILAYDIWRNRYGSDPDILGRSIKVNGEQATVIGVLGEGFGFPQGNEIWVPMRDTPSQVDRGDRPLTVMGRLNDGVTFEQAETELAGIASGLAAQFPETNEGVGIRFMSYVAFQTPLSFGSIFIVMMVAVVFVLLVACANVANILLARAAMRSKEAAVRTALGGSRVRVVLPFFSEAVLLSLIAAVVGTLIAFGAVRTFDNLTVQFRPFWIEFVLDLPVLLYVVATAVLTSIAAGALPAYQIARADVNAILKDEARGSSSFHLGRVSKILVVGEVALSCALLVGSGLMAKSMRFANSVDPGFEHEELLTARVGLFPTVYPDPEARERFFWDLTDRLEAHPRIANAALTSSLPFGGTGEVAISIEGQEYQDEQDLPDAGKFVVSPGFFETLGVSVLRGRDFAREDRGTRAKVAIVNQAFATVHFAGESPVGRRFREGMDVENPWLTIVGMSPSLGVDGLANLVDSVAYYVPLAQDDQQFMSIIARAQGGDPLVLTAEVRRIVRALDNDLPIYNVQSMTELLGQFGFFLSIFGWLFVIFGLITLVIALVGLYGVISFTVSRRVQEIGVRVALGAQARDIVKLVLRQGMMQIGIGMALGLVAAAGVSSVLSNLLFGVEPRDPVVFVGVFVLVMSVGLFATWIPARRASGVDPLLALRAE